MAVAFTIGVVAIVNSAVCLLAIIVSAYRTTILISGAIGTSVLATLVVVVAAPASCLLACSFSFSSLFELDCSSFGSFVGQLETHKFGNVLEIILL